MMRDGYSMIRVRHTDKKWLLSTIHRVQKFCFFFPFCIFVQFLVPFATTFLNRRKKCLDLTQKILENSNITTAFQKKKKIFSTPIKKYRIDIRLM